jgi:hypothetical protein
MEVTKTWKMMKKKKRRRMRFSRKTTESSMTS